MSSPSLSSTRYSSLSSCSELCFFQSANVISSKSKLWPWKAWRVSFIRCAVDETPDPNTKRRASYSGAQRIERSLEATKRRSRDRHARSFPSRPLLISLHERIRQNQWLPALRIFELVRSQPWYVGETATYLKLFNLLATARQPEEASRLFTFMLEDNVRPSTAIFTALLTVYTKTNYFRKAVQTFESMRLYEGCVPDKYTYTSMIKGCCEAELYDQAKKIFHEMVVEGVKPSIVTYNTLIFGYGQGGLFREIERVLTMMETNGVTPDTVTWNTLIRVFGLHNKISHMEHAYEGLLGQGLKPDVVTLNILIAAYGTAGLFAKMESVITYMARYDFPMTVVTYNSLVEAYGKAGMIEEMEKVVQGMYVRPNRGTFCAILNAYGQHGRWHLVDKVLAEAHQWDAVNTAVYNAAIDAYQRAQNFEEMEKVFAEMKRKGFVPDDVTYGILIGAYKRVMRLEKAEQVHEEWDTAKKQSDSKSN